jgi:hypothetical protein
MRRLMIGCALGVIVLCLVACTSSSASTETAQALQRQADLYQIDQIEKNFHEATTKKDIDQMMSLWAPNATLTIGPGQTAAGLSQIRGFWLGQSTALGLGPPGVQGRDHGQRGPGYAPLRVPLRQLRHQEGGVRHGRRPGRRAHRRTVADHEHDRGNHHTDPLSPCSTYRMNEEEQASPRDGGR